MMGWIVNACLLAILVGLVMRASTYGPTAILWIAMMVVVVLLWAILEWIGRKDRIT